MFEFVRVCVSDEKQGIKKCVSRKKRPLFIEVTGPTDLEHLYFGHSSQRSHSDQGISSTHFILSILSADSPLCCFLLKE